MSLSVNSYIAFGMKTLIVANWKMNPQDLVEARQIFNSLKKGMQSVGKRGKNIEIIVCPPFLYLYEFLRGLRKIHIIKLGAQNCFWEEGGAFTGEISPKQLLNLGCQYVILGHSERRRYFGETDEIINKKIKKSLEFKLNPIFCVGENLQEREKGQTIMVLQTQTKEGLKKVTKKEVPKIIIAYEPIWAIGLGRACPINEAQSMGLLIKKIIAQMYGRTVSKNLRVLYGGSVNSQNAADYIKEAHLDGLLVGGASLKPAEFIRIVKSVLHL